MRTKIRMLFRGGCNNTDGWVTGVLFLQSAQIAQIFLTTVHSCYVLKAFARFILFSNTWLINPSLSKVHMYKTKSTYIYVGVFLCLLMAQHLLGSRCRASHCVYSDFTEWCFLLGADWLTGPILWQTQRLMSKLTKLISGIFRVQIEIRLFVCVFTAYPVPSWM